MEKKGGWSQKQSLINELAQGRELARQLHIYLNAASSSSSQESLDLLLQKIQHSLQKALLILSCNGASLGNILSPSESPLSLNASPTSDKGADPHASRKIRNSLPCWTEKVTVNPDMLLEGPPDDNFSWRKYGQKDILGAKFPRGYYRCTQRNVSGCPATKLVQRSDDDPNMLEITYRGNHTCTHNNINPPSLAPLPQINPPSVLDDYDYLINQHRLPQFEYPTMTSKPSLNVITENLDTTLDHHNQSFPSISFDNFASINELDHVIIPAYNVNFPEDHLFGPPDHSFIFPSGLLQNGLNDGNPDLAPTSSGMSPFSRVEPDPEFTFGNQGKFS